jgi:hypothetical protein
MRVLPYGEALFSLGRTHADCILSVFAMFTIQRKLDITYSECLWIAFQLGCNLDDISFSGLFPDHPFVAQL